MTSGDARLRAARTRYDDAVHAERRARVAAAPEIRARRERLRRAARWGVVACVLVIVGCLVAAALFVWSGARDQRRLDDDEQARDTASTTVAALLTADPAHADAYVDRVLSLTAGAQHERVAKARDQLRDAVAAEPEPNTGQVLSAGVTGRSGDDVVVVLVAQASDPSLIGASAADRRITLRVTMTERDDRWLLSRSEVVE
ncbi:MAG: hypothetical protein QM658_02265 [Gordonia sp. (in: high G+C Gram-positive bacteria)]